mmetsp:Transcript_21072/g.33037  ORF Transcript_21072/g.33037 Transcript_21072/m.33037 type:complete len:207 (-) Transcript_21072:127-747(-)
MLPQRQSFCRSDAFLSLNDMWPTESLLLQAMVTLKLQLHRYVFSRTLLCPLSGFLRDKIRSDKCCEDWTSDEVAVRVRLVAGIVGIIMLPFWILSRGIYAGKGCLEIAGLITIMLFCLLRCVIEWALLPPLAVVAFCMLAVGALLTLQVYLVLWLVDQGGRILNSVPSVLKQAKQLLNPFSLSEPVSESNVRAQAAVGPSPVLNNV